MNVVFCRHSTLREVYAAVVGLPAPLNRDEFTTLRTRFTREWPEHELSSLQVLAPLGRPLQIDPAADSSPAWFGQINWGPRRWLGRWGHRISALHRLLDGDETYETFTRTVRPGLEQWLAATRDAYGFIGIDPPVASVVFGYVNAFRLGVDDGDLSEWFRFNFAIEASGAEQGLNELAFGAQIGRPVERSRATISLSAKLVDEVVQVDVHTRVERDVSEETHFGDLGPLLAEIDHAKLIAKETFFSFVTERTLERMGATDAEPEA